MSAVGEQIGTIRGGRISGPGSALLPWDGPSDIFISDGHIADIAPAGAMPPQGEVVDAHGGWVLPGLWDHHVHVLQTALSAQRRDVGEAVSAVHAASLMAQTPPLVDGRRVGVGFRDALWNDVPSLAILDEATGQIPTYIINADVHSVWMNSAALRREQMDAADGVVREEPAFEISRRLNHVDPRMGDAHVWQMARAAASRGVVGLVDFDMEWNDESWARRLEGGFDELRVRFGIYPMFLQRAITEGLRTGDPVRGALSDLVRVGPLKVIRDGSLGTRTAACSHPYTGDPQNHGVLTIDNDTLRELMTIATANGIDSAIHAIGDVAGAGALDAFAFTGARGTIEHAQLVAHADIQRFARLGITASVQPEHAIDDRDITDVEWSGQTALAYPLRALADAGVALQFGSDAPVSPLDPWAALAAATFRTRDGREPWRPEQALDIDTALAASTHSGSLSPETVVPGALADLVVVDADPEIANESELRGMSVRATMISSRLTHVA
ncbi:hypothetical protein FHX49_000107 [Microbacterium endophyticum]|uniref:Amidohydrolase 3 domain-containing protein n=1 Tax=Microbacterium endophyticum TaxID=1526412 RepID=A0A7W4V0D9_9MICO|nr:amidohydrolase family protein [Microbacterium endophyticum]MBB2974566.1 hypothetical protein [Microbacterium endophyticum]NIK36863.1 hypothetical protein [Microbacterium endophyticum]